MARRPDPGEACSTASAVEPLTSRSMTSPPVSADVVRDQRQDLVQHMTRLFKVVEMKVSAEHDREDIRARNLHKRLTQVESELRQLRRKGTYERAGDPATA